MRRVRRDAGFTLVEMLVSVAILAVLVGLLARPVNDVLRSLLRVSREGEGFARNLLFLDQIDRDVRSAVEIEWGGSSSIVLTRPGGETVAWSFAPDAADRLRAGSSARFPIAARSLSASASHDLRGVVLEGEFDGLGRISRTTRLRVDAI